MSGTFPTAGFTTLDFQSNNNVKMTQSLSGRTQRIKTGGQFWSFKLQSPPMNRADFFAQYSFIVQQDGQAESFTIVPPQISSTRGNATGTITVLDDSTYTGASIALGSKSVPVDNSGNTGTLKKGDLIKFSNHDKVYMLTEDANLDGSSVNELNIYPSLVSEVTGSTTIVYTDVPFTVYFDSNVLSFATGADGSYRYQITCNEEI
jgi:hypothetical protein